MSKPQYLVRFWSNDLVFNPAEERVNTLKAAKEIIKEWQRKYVGDSYEILTFTNIVVGDPVDILNDKRVK